MRYSVLIPTKNRLSLLRLAVQSVLDQDYGDWEIVVSDNASTDPVAQYVDSLEDRRVRYWRSDRSITVTENWNRAFDHCSGDYVIMLGDDDALLPGYMRINAGLLTRFRDPEAVFVQGIQYAYAGVIPGRQSAFIQVANCEFLDEECDPFVLERSRARQAAASAFAFRVVYPFNMQYLLVKRATMQRLARGGRFYQSPYPDYYAANLLMLDADPIVVQPLPLVAVGISPRSFGYYYFNQRESEGVDFLNNIALEEERDPVRDVILPGPDMNTSWLIAMATAKRNANEGADLAVRHDLYRFMQFRWTFSSEPFVRFCRILLRHGHWREINFWVGMRIYAQARRLLLRRPGGQLALLDRLHTPYPSVWIYSEEVPQRDILAFARQFSPESFLSQYLTARRAACAARR